MRWSVVRRVWALSLCCLQVSEKFLNGHSNALLEVVGVSIQKSPAPQLAKAALLMAAED